MIGIDITRISRFKDPTNTFIKKILHPNEIKQYEIEKDKPLFLASRWAIKEALFKANNEEFSFNKIEIKKQDRFYKLEGYSISTSKEDDYYIAIVMKEK